MAPPGERAMMTDQLTKTTTRVRGLGTLILGFVAVQLFVNIANGGVANLLIPNRLALLDPANKVTLLGIAAAGAAAVGLIAQPLFGMLSDRTRGRFGRRLPWIAVGIVGFATSIAALAFAQSFLAICVLLAVMTVFFSMILAPIGAVVPDRTPVDKRGLFSALAGIGVFVGGILGVLVASQFVADIDMAFLVLAVVALSALAFALPLREKIPRELAVAKKPLRETLAGFFVNPKEHPDFFWAFVARLVIVLGFQSVLSFQLYILSDYVGLGLAEANSVYPLAIAIGTLALILALVPAGVISDRIGRRKVIVVIGAVLVAISTIPPLIAPTVPSALISIGIAGLGIGTYLAVDQALMTQVLPSKADAGKDLGVLNVAQAGGQVLAPVAASIVIGLAGYTGLYIFAGILSLASAFAIWPIKSVK